MSRAKGTATAAESGKALEQPTADGAKHDAPAKPEPKEDPPAIIMKRRKAVHRPSSDASRWHMSKDAIDRGGDEFASWSDLKCVRHLATMRWGDYCKVVCPHCTTGAEHYFSQDQLRWKCKACGKRFSVTSQTVFANRRMPLQKLLAAIHMWAVGVAGQPALEIRRYFKFGGYNTAFTLVSKLREGLLRGFNTGLLSGVIEMDGAHASGRRASEKRGKPQNYRSMDNDEATEEALLTTSAKRKKKRDAKAAAAAALAAGGDVPVEHGSPYPATRRLVFTVRRRSGVQGKGAAFTRVGVGLAETPDVAQALAEAYVAMPESVLATDTSPAFNALGKKFRLHLSVNHSETLVGPEGEHVNFSESFNARQDRSEKGIYLNIEPKYLSDYVSETAFREDHRRMAPGAAADRALHFALNVGLSHYWRGFTHGRHREHEILATGNQPAGASGPPKGQSPIAQVNGRPPR